ncbi:hypothetical protein F8154_11080 [Alkaliphilus pronyensis]|uniref:Uncharacterized protein n=1 Tax=Alkaliphilus pronyensis TaxID=1482732 RepID=A0A6I0F7M9_9FIRM|nr:hypothetical protein [Alkaliphilus pronyensis]KAB3532936.1 hypothetical protein F8154_11080 [Alkaliphilus pronyensis]
MPTKKEEILEMINSGKSVEEIVQLGFNKKYVKEVIRGLKKPELSRDENDIKAKNQDNSKTLGDEDIAQMQKDINEIKKLLISQNSVYTKGSHLDNKLEIKKKQLEDTLKILNFIMENEPLLNHINLNVNIAISDNESNVKTEKVDNNNFKDSMDIKINPIELYREKGEIALKDILNNFDIAVLKDIARQYTPDARGYVYKWSDATKIIDYIIERSKNLAEKGSVFVTD